MKARQVVVLQIDLDNLPNGKLPCGRDFGVEPRSRIRRKQVGCRPAREQEFLLVLHGISEAPSQTIWRPEST